MRVRILALAAAVAVTLGLAPLPSTAVVPPSTTLVDAAAHHRALPTNVDYYRNRHSGMCMTVRGGSLSNNALVEQAPCAGSTSQQWAFEWAGYWSDGPAYYLRNVRSQKCLTVYQGSTANGGLMTQYTCLAQTNQIFLMDINTPSSSHLKAVNSGKCVRVRGASMVKGALLEQQSCSFSSSATDQLWNYT